MFGLVRPYKLTKEYTKNMSNYIEYYNFVGSVPLWDGEILCNFDTVAPLNKTVVCQAGEVTGSDPKGVAVITNTEHTIEEGVMPSVATVGTASIPIASNVRDNIQQDDQLSRIIVVGNFNWVSTSPGLDVAGPNTELVKYVFPQNLITASPWLQEKMNGFKFLHSDIKVSIRYNGPPFSYGSLMAVWMPYQTKVEASAPYRVSTYARSLSSYPHQLMVVGLNDSMDIYIPFCAEEEYFDLSDASPPEFGELRVYCCNPLVGVTLPLTVSCTVFAQLVNPRLHGPCARRVVAMGNAKGPVRQVRAQAGGSGREQKQVAKSGLVTKISGFGTSILENFAPVISKIPIIGNFTPELTWIARSINKVASAFGWSKPVNLVAPVRALVQYGTSNAAFEGPDYSIVMAGSYDNTIDPVSAVPIKEDEMDFSYIFQRRFIEAFAYVAPGTAYGANVYAALCRPIGVAIQPTTTPTQISLSSSQFLIGMHAYWRGTQWYRIVVVAPIMLTGRFVIQHWLESTGSTLNDMEITNNLVMDISQQRVFDFPVRFISDTPYHQVWATASDPLTAGTGRIDINVLVPLSGPETVPLECRMIIYRWFGEDFEIATYQNYYDFGAAAEDSFVNVPRTPVRCQSGGENDIAMLLGNIYPVVVDNSDYQYDPHEVSKFCIGERITSARQLIKRPGSCLGLAQAGTGTPKLPTNMITVNANVADSYTGVNTYSSTIQWLGLIYRFWAGGVRLKFQFLKTNTNPAVPGEQVATNSRARIESGRYTPGRYPKNAAIEIPVTSDAEFVEVQCPFYAGVRKFFLGNRTPRNLCIRYLADGQVRIPTIFASAADDFNYHYLIGPPVVYLVAYDYEQGADEPF